MDLKAHFVPLGEADGVCAVLAERLGGYVMGQDSDFVILMGEGGRAKGYVPFDGLSWFEGEVKRSEEARESGTLESGDEDEFTTVSNTKIRRSRESPLLPPSEYTNPTLNLTVYPPSALRIRLRIPSNVLPLFASLCGTDYTPPQASFHFFEQSQNLVSRIEKVARILREQLYSPNIQAKGTAGDHAADIVSRVIKKLLVRPFYTESEGHALVDSIVDSTLQYTLPTLGRCCEYHPFCGALDQDKGCQSESPEGVREGVRAFSRASERGEFRSARQGYFYPGSVFPYQVLEDPGRGSLKAQGLVGVRKLAWEILDEVLGLRFEPEPEPETEPDLEESSTMVELDATMTVQDGEQVGGEEMDQGLDKDDIRFGLKNDTGIEEMSQSTLVEGADAGLTHPTDTNADIDIELKSSPSQPRTVTEYIRSSNRITPHTITLEPPTSSIRALQPLQDRLKTYLTPFHSNTPAISALPRYLQPIVALIRFCVLDSANWPGHEQSWRSDEIQAVLQSCLGTFQQWQREDRGDVPSKKELEMPYPLLSGRNAQLVAHLQATMTDSLILAESLLLSNSRDGNEDQREEDTLTHLRVFKFYSGQTLHTFLNRSIPEGWKWGESDQAIFDTCWEALVDGIEDKIVGFIPTVKESNIVPERSLEENDTEAATGPETGTMKKRKKNKSKSGGAKNQKSSGQTVGGRFDLLNGLMD